MKKIAIIAAMLFASCDVTQPVAVNVLSGNLAKPATEYNLLASFTSALPCAGQPLDWSIREQGAGWVAIDGSITQAGLWTSPGCGSIWLGQVLHVDAKCASTGQTATATIATVPEQVSGVQLAYAVVTNPGQAACLAANPLAPVIQAGGAVQFFARVVTTCGEVVTPTPPDSWPAVCP